MTRIFVTAAAAVWAVAASAEIEWLSKSYDYGTFRESEGLREGSVRFVNKGPEATFIGSVRPSCGCTGATYTEDVIEPGDTATVSFVYNPAGRPGPFDKTVKVYVGEDNEMHVVRIKGTVIGSPATLESSYPLESGPLRFQSLERLLGEIRKGQNRHLFVNVYNQGTDTIRPQWRSNSDAMEADLTPKALAPGEIGTFGLYLNTSRERQMGPVEYKVEVRPDKGSPSSEVRVLTVGATIVPDPASFGEEEMKNSGRANLIPEFVDFGDKSGESGESAFEFVILNDGNRPLEVSRVYSRHGGVTIKKSPRKINPGKRGTVRGSLDLSEVAKGPFRIYVEVITDDSLHPVRRVSLVGEKNE